MDSQEVDSLRNHSLYWEIETIPAISWGVLGKVTSASRHT